MDVTGVDVHAYTIPTDEPESDGTLDWEATTVVVVEAHADGATGVGYTYGDRSVAEFVESKLAGLARGADAMAPPAVWAAMQAAIRNDGRQGVGAMAISAVDIALWDLKARLLGVPLADVLPRFHRKVPVYGSGGFTSYSVDRLRDQLSGWAAQGIGRVKITVGREPRRDPLRLRAAREAVGPDVDLMVDANGAYTRKEALSWAEAFAHAGVRWLEEPVSSDDLEGMQLVRDRAPAGVEIAAGEYGWDLPQLAAMADCVDVLQADVTRCGGITNMIRVDALCKARGLAFSAHCAPAVSAHVCAAMECARDIEYFHDHVRAERILFEGTLDPDGGALEPAGRPGLGLTLKHGAAERYAA
jgi:L-alanine-DL-glutamate epimerase-like enolase superfamily enzyme